MVPLSAPQIKGRGCRGRRGRRRNARGGRSGNGRCLRFADAQRGANGLRDWRSFLDGPQRLDGGLLTLGDCQFGDFGGKGCGGGRPVEKRQNSMGRSQETGPFSQASRSTSRRQKL